MQAQAMQGGAFGAGGAADAAAAEAGVPVPQAGGLANPGIFSNPITGPMLYNSMMGGSFLQGPAASSSGSASSASSAAAANLGATQLGMMLMMGNQQSGGIGTGRISGTRGYSRQRTSASTSAGSNSRSRNTDRPGGLASRFFNRSAGHPAYPQGYFNRRPNYFP